jgi:hypothetical protein
MKETPQTIIPETIQNILLTNKMKVTREVSNELIELQEDVASQFCHDNFPISGELYWTLVESIATAKLAELQS